MKSFVALLAVVAVVAADVSHIVNPDRTAEILEQSADVYPDQYNFSFKTSNGISGQESGALEKVGSEAEGIAVRGSSSYTAPGGELIETTYTADANGYHPQGAHLPTPPAPQPIPEYIVRALEYIRTHPPKPEPGQRS